jgi:hypothetical protein
MKKALLIGLAILLIAAFVGYKFLFKSHRDISSEDISFTVTVQDLTAEFSKNDSLANAKYADKTIEVSGVVDTFDKAAHSAIIDGKLSVVFADSTLSDLPLQKKVKLKGRFVGYDDLLEEFKMDQVTIQN